MGKEHVTNHHIFLAVVDHDNKTLGRRRWCGTRRLSGRDIVFRLGRKGRRVHTGLIILGSIINLAQVDTIGNRVELLPAQVGRGHLGTRCIKHLVFELKVLGSDRVPKVHHDLASTHLLAHALTLVIEDVDIGHETAVIDELHGSGGALQDARRGDGRKGKGEEDLGERHCENSCYITVENYLFYVPRNMPGSNDLFVILSFFVI
ncbi:hypothetical protein MT325_m277L [Paramecium bursaria chlorella virus MT325]|uniref:Uncharacterized protein m277L n=1 Tax=Paramecium bursaria Chlorella virus MT325 TaxID=346932 RepID=A7IU07_PBCVM|nr:hypothetical protein MT325_m277L [Paramecium bursaria chlorella virus MT325]